MTTQGGEVMDLAQYVSDYMQTLRDCGMKIPPRKKLAREISGALLDHNIEVSPEEVEYYL
jgi:hypothetical protein